MRLAIIVPYRDRREQLDIFLPHMEEFLANKEINYKLFIAEQSDDRPFNYGKLCNAVMNEIIDEYDYFCFHDIDLLPINDSADYTYKEYATQLAYENETEKIILPYPNYYGGVVIFPRDIFLKINGFGNDYWGKGYVDLDLLYRCIKNDVKLVKEYDYSNGNPFHLDLKRRSIKANRPIVKFPPKVLIKTELSDILAKDFSLSFFFKQSINSKTTIIRTYNGFDFQVFCVDNQMIIQFFEKNETLFQIDIPQVDLYSLNHYTITHSFFNKEFCVYYNGKEIDKRNYALNYEFSNKNVILGDIQNEETLELVDFRLFSRTLNNNEVTRNYYYGLNDASLDFTKFCLFTKNGSQLIDNDLNVWSIFGAIDINENNYIRMNNPTYVPNRIKGTYQVIGDKFEELEKTFDPDILENRRTYLDDLLGKKININKFGFKSVKYTLLDRNNFNNNTEWLKISI